MKHHPGPVHIFTCAQNIKFRVTAGITNTIIDRIIDLTGMNNITHHTFYVNEQTEQLLFDTQKYYKSIGLYNILYTGITLNPPLEVMATFPPQYWIPEGRDPTVNHPVIDVLGNYTPFINVNKKGIAAIYEELGLMETLFPLTRSCATRKKGVWHCGDGCWWCHERSWGFGRLS